MAWAAGRATGTTRQPHERRQHELSVRSCQSPDQHDAGRGDDTVQLQWRQSVIDADHHWHYELMNFLRTLGYRPVGRYVAYRPAVKLLEAGPDEK